MNKIFISIILMFSIVNAKFSRKDSNNVVIDTKTHLIWEDLTTSEAKIFKDALTYCKDKTDGGYSSNWRLPNYNELFSLLDYNKIDIKINDKFKDKKSFYWTSTISKIYYDDNRTLNRAWIIDFSSGYDYTGSIDDQYKVNVRCVHDF